MSVHKKYFKIANQSASAEISPFPYISRRTANTVCTRKSFKSYELKPCFSLKPLTQINSKSRELSVSLTGSNFFDVLKIYYFGEVERMLSRPSSVCCATTPEPLRMSWRRFFATSSDNHQHLYDLDRYFRTSFQRIPTAIVIVQQ